MQTSRSPEVLAAELEDELWVGSPPCGLEAHRDSPPNHFQACRTSASNCVAQEVPPLHGDSSLSFCVVHRRGHVCLGMVVVMMMMMMMGTVLALSSL